MDDLDSLYVYFTDDGEIVRVASDPKDIQLDFIVVSRRTVADPAVNHVVDGGLVPYTPEQAAAKASQPFPQAKWSNATMAWIDPRTLADLKTAKLAALKTARDAQQFGGFTWDGSPFDSDERSQSVLLGMFTTALAGLLPNTPFRLQDNSWRVLTAQDMPQVWGALQLLIEGAFTQFAALEAAVVAASTAEEVAAVHWP